MKCRWFSINPVFLHTHTTYTQIHARLSQLDQRVPLLNHQANSFTALDIVYFSGYRFTNTVKYAPYALYCIMTAYKILQIVTVDILMNTYNGRFEMKWYETHLLADVLAAFEVMVSVGKDLRLHNGNDPVLQPRTQLTTHNS